MIGLSVKEGRGRGEAGNDNRHTATLDAGNDDYVLENSEENQCTARRYH